MKKALLPFVLFLGYVAIFILQAFYPSPFPENKDQQILDKADIYYAKFPQEKIYLHLDRSSYWTNDDIWFKAYLKDSPIPECNFYVELMNGAGTIVQKKLFWAQNGLAYGDLHASDTLSSGVYQIRAYTSWMRNFEDQWFFRKDLVILNPRDKKTSDEFFQLSGNDIDFQFFPEGGTFLAGVDNKVAFKATDNHGKGLDVEGKVMDEQGNEVARFKSQFRGMGNFILQPGKGNKYTAEIVLNDNIKKKVKLPSAEEFGVSLSIDPGDSVKLPVHISVGSTGNNPNNNFLLVGQANGLVAFKSEVKLTNDVCNLVIMKDSLPQGIIQFTLFDENLVPKCERLIFINHHDYLDVAILPDQEDYLPRGKVQLQLTALPKSGNPMPANLSVSVFNQENQLNTEKYPGNILTYFLLNSELKGLIEDPAWYFKDDSLPTRLALDNLMLTHGYRHFEWKEITDNRQPKISWQPEPNIQLKGTVYSAGLNRPVPNGKVTMMTVKSLLDIREQKTDSTGQFIFSDLFFNDTILVTLQSRNKKGKALAGIELDERSSTSPPAGILPLMYEYSKENPTHTVTYLSELSPEILNRKWHLSDTILLGDINIMSRKKKTDDGHVRPYLDADYVVDVTKFDNVFGDISESLEVNSPQYRSFSRREAQLFLDGVPIKYPELVTSLPASWFDKVEFVRMAPIPGAGFGPGIYFYTKRGAPNEKPEWASGITSTKLVGYSVIRSFYSPVYDGSEDKKNNKKDFRNTLYWNPIVRTDSNGDAEVSFYNSDQTGDINIVVEGVTADGKLCRGVGKYKVKD